MTIKLSDIIKDVNLKERVGGFNSNPASTANFIFYTMGKFEGLKNPVEKAQVAKMAAKAQRALSDWGNGTCNTKFNKMEKASEFYKNFVKEAPSIKGALENEEVSKLIAAGLINRKAKQEAKKQRKAIVEKPIESKI